MTKLEACNIALAALRLGAVSTLDTEDGEVAEWTKHFDNAMKEVLSHGWLFNTDMLTLSPTDGKILVRDYLKVPVLAQKNLTVRNGYVWDPELAAYHNQSLGKVAVVVSVAWEDIPHAFQEWIAYKAATMFVHQVKGAVQDYLIYQRLEQSYMAKAERTYKTDIGTGTGFNSIKAEYRR